MSANQGIQISRDAAAARIYADDHFGSGKSIVVIYPGAGPIDYMLNGGDGYLYVAPETDSLVRMDPRTIEFDHLGRPSPAPRIPAADH